MTSIFILSLCFLQIITFGFLSFLFTKVSKNADLEKKQQTLMREMDDSIGIYLAELKDENDRLIEKLSKRADIEEKPISTEPVIEYIPSVKAPINLALKSYQSTNQDINKTTVPGSIDDRTRVIQLHEAGQSTEKIAKMLGKGRTEVELILKFS